MEAPEKSVESFPSCKGFITVLLPVTEWGDLSVWCLLSMSLGITIDVCCTADVVISLTCL